jgi:hypothetical protein
LDDPVAPRIFASRFDPTTIPHPLDSASGLHVHEEAVGRYLDLEPSEDLQGRQRSVFVRIYYTEADLDRTGNGGVGDHEDFDESTLGLYRFDPASEMWSKLSPQTEGVIELGVDIGDCELFGNVYAGHVWAYLAEEGTFGLGGLLINRPPDVSDAYPSIASLWPPNHVFVDVRIEGVTDPDGDEVTVTILHITSDEPTASVPGDPAPDASGIGGGTASLRAERLGTGNGRVYAITFMATDAAGGASTGTVTVEVPHDEDSDPSIDDGQDHDATEGGAE